MLARLHEVEDKATARTALRDILGEVLMKTRGNGEPVAQIDTGRTMAACLENNGSGGRI